MGNASQWLPESTKKAGAPNDSCLLNALKTLFRLFRVLLDLQKCILSGAKKFISVRSSSGNLSLFEIIRLQYYFPENFSRNLKFYESNSFSDSSLQRIFESENFRFPFSTVKNSLTWGMKWDWKIELQKIVGNLLDKLRKLYMNGTVI